MDNDGMYLRSHSSPENARQERKLILSVDDELGVLYSRYKLLSSAGYAVLSATDAVQALGVFASEKVDLVLLDFVLPGMDGGMLAEALKTYAPQVPVVFVTGTEVPGQYRSICDGYLHKGDDPEQLLGAVRELLFPIPPPEIDRNRTCL